MAKLFLMKAVFLLFSVFSFAASVGIVLLLFLADSQLLFRFMERLCPHINKLDAPDNWAVIITYYVYTALGLGVLGVGFFGLFVLAHWASIAQNGNSLPCPTAQTKGVK